MDLPERLSMKIKSRFGDDSMLVRRTFAPYTYKEMEIILQHRLKDLSTLLFERHTLEFCARNAAKIAGDVRTALNICQR